MASRPWRSRPIPSHAPHIVRRTPTRSATPTIAREVQGGARRMVICGMHVHIGLEDDELRIDVMNQLSYFVPHLLALSCSSPFWEGDDMGMHSFRLMLLSSLPPHGLPEQFDSYGEFRRHLEALVSNGLIEDTTKIWWDIRPSSRYPTLETGVFDCCTYLDDAVCLAALNLALVRMLYRLRRENKTWRRYPRMLIAENRWRAMRFGSDASLLDLARGELVPFAELLEELLILVHEDAVALDCLAEANTRARFCGAEPAHTGNRTSTRWRAGRARPTAKRCRR